eukprot:9346383-Alexandrium_andersonii.AAC.2
MAGGGRARAGAGYDEQGAGSAPAHTFAVSLGDQTCIPSACARRFRLDIHMCRRRKTSRTAANARPCHPDMLTIACRQA